MKRKNAKRLAKQITRYLLQSGTRLVIETESKKLDGAGWCGQAVMDQIVARLTKKHGGRK